jgi:hypothetical protein
MVQSSSIDGESPSYLILHSLFVLDPLLSPVQKSLPQGLALEIKAVNLPDF